MAAPVLFLDFDGVLNSLDYVHRGGVLEGVEAIDPAAVARLNAVCDPSGARVVVSSTWRLGRTRAELGEILRARGFTGKLIGVTPDLARANPSTGVVRFVERHEEIRTWIAEAEHRGPFAILDDAADAEVPGHFVQTTWEMGLLDEHIEAALAILSRSPTGR